MRSSRVDPATAKLKTPLLLHSELCWVLAQEQPQLHLIRANKEHSALINHTLVCTIK
jgi:hypothetical protein